MCKYAKITFLSNAWLIQKKWEIRKYLNQKVLKVIYFKFTDWIQSGLMDTEREREINFNAFTGKERMQIKVVRVYIKN